MLNKILKNWKTTSAGVGGLLISVGSLLTKISNGDYNVIAELSAIILSLGLLFGKDADVTGGSKPNA